MPKQPKPIRITEHWSAKREVQKFVIITRLFYREPDMANGGGYITVVSSLEFPLGSFDHQEWTAAEINWFSLLPQPKDFVAEWVKALAWAVREAARIDRGNIQRNAKLREGAKTS